ncbi:MAG: MATE family efflux transporter [Rhodospirillales bacterium]|jgi:MATE family multidrug resistance protein
MFNETQKSDSQARTSLVLGRVRLEARETVRLALPLVFTALSFKIMTATDVVMMGWLGAQFLAASALANYIYFPMYIMAAGIVTAVAPLAAQAMGARRFKAVRRTVRQGLWIALLLSSLGAFALLHGEAFLIAIDQEPAIAALSGEYLRAAAWALVPAIGFAVLQFFLSALGRPQAVFLIASGGIVVNGFTNYVLMYGKFGLPALGLTGIGLSTSIVTTMLFISLTV